MHDTASTILVLDDDPRILNLLQAVLSEKGFKVATVENGKRARALLESISPDLFLLDVTMPGEDGIEFCRALQRDPRFAQTPIIFVTARDETDDIIRGFEAGAADYIRKPINKPELLARVRTHLRLYHNMRELERLRQLALDASPSTGLPGNNSITDAIIRSLETRQAHCVIYCDLNNFKSFNDRYGFIRGDRVIKYTAEVIEAAAKATRKDAFVGHIGGDDYIVIVDSDQAAAVAEDIIRRFDGGIRDFYDPEDRAADGIHSEDRQGNRRFFPIMSISLAAVDLSRRSFNHHLMVADECAQLKKLAKQCEKSSVVFDRRKDPPPKNQP